MLLVRALRTLVLGIVVGGVAVGACLAALVPGGAEIVSAHHYTVKTVTKLRDLSQKSTVLWSDFTKMDELGLQDRQSVTYGELAGSQGGQRVINAVISTEDQTFWTNDGIDLGAVFRAFVTNVTSGGIEQGGSTITQQLVKNRILSPARDVNRKVKEIEDALRLNEKFSKKKILEEYLNTVYFGQNSYGIKSAASRFFITQDPGCGFPRGKHLDELTIGEAALLAGVIANPEGTNPFTYPSRAIKRRGDVLQAEVGQGYITQAEADAANLEPLPTWLPQDQLRPSNLLTAEVQDRLLEDPRLGSTTEGAPQHAAQGRPHDRDHLRQGPAEHGRRRDPERVAEQSRRPRLGVVAGRDRPANWCGEGDEPRPPASPTVSTTSGRIRSADSRDPPGRSSPSPLRWPTATRRMTRSRGKTRAACRSSSATPPPSTRATARAGSTTLWAQTAGSVNCAFVRLSTSVGQDKVMEMAHKLGITQQRLFPHLTLSIGDIEATPLEMATVIATIANGGVHQTPYFVSGLRALTASRLTGFDEQSGRCSATGCSTRTSPSASS